jgi:phage major head subunit gpT-like protein
MIVNRGNLDSIFTAFNTRFSAGFTAAPSYYRDCAMVVPSTSREETYAWLGNSAPIREWIGPRVVSSLSGFGYTIKNKTYEKTQAVDRNDIEDDKVGIYGPMFEMMGREVAMFPDEQVFTLLARGFTAECYDGQYFFDTDHPVGLPGIIETASVSNVQAGAGAPWFLMDCSQPLKPLIYQERKPFNFVRKDREEDDNVFFNREFLYGADGRSNVGFGLWQLAFASKDTLNAANYKAARSAMQSLKSDTGKVLGIKPTHMFVPPSLESDGLKLLNAALINGGESNEWAGTAKLVVSPFLA